MGIFFTTKGLVIFSQNDDKICRIKAPSGDHLCQMPTNTKDLWSYQDKSNDKSKHKPLANIKGKK